MHTSVVKLRPENILEIAKDVIRPTAWYCEWNTAGLQKPVMCRTALNSWNAYLQHLVYHCQQIKGSGNFVCRLPRCNTAGLSISSYSDLVNHIQQSHLNRAQLCCPIRGCTSISFSRPGLLEVHFREDHANLIDQELPLSSPVLLPTWRPFRPDCSILPAPLPSSIAPGTGLIPLVSGVPFQKIAPVFARHTTLEMPSSQLSQSSPRKRNQLQAAPSEESIVSVTPDIVFADLPRRKPTDNDIAADYVVRQKALLPDLSRPQDILDPARYGYRIPPGSILYHNFVRIHGDVGDDEDDEEEEDAPA